MENQDVQSSELSDSQIDALVDGPQETVEETPQAAKPAETPEYTLKVNGQEIKAPVDKVLQWAQMGYNYPQKANELKQQQEQLTQSIAEKERALKELEQRLNPYKEVDEYASKNPDWWTQVNQAYQQKSMETKSLEELNKIKTELEDIKSFKEQLAQEREQQRIEQEDRQLAQEIESIRKTYPNIDFTTPDGSGESLEVKVLNHAVKNDIKNFKTAFRDYYHEHLVGKATETGKEQAIKELQKRTKLGLLSESLKPSESIRPVSSPRAKSYNDILKETLDELNQLNGG